MAHKVYFFGGETFLLVLSYRFRAPAAGGQSASLRDRAGMDGDAWAISGRPAPRESWGGLKTGYC